MAESTPDQVRVEERLRAGDRRFSKLEQRIDASDANTKAHLHRQDEQIAAIASDVSTIRANTQAMVDAWDGGARTMRFLCRLAEAWRFMLKHVAIPGVAAVAVGTIVVRYLHNEAVPEWAGLLLKLIVG